MARPRTTTPTKPADARAERSIEALCSAFLNLLERQTFEKITIRDITDAAGLSYPTFFRRFAGKEELLDYIASEEIRRLLGLLGKSALNQPYRANSGQEFCDYIQKHRKLWKTLLTGGAASVMHAEFMRLSREFSESRPRINPWLPLDLAVPFIASGIFEILAWWMRMPEDYPEENVIKLFNVLIFDPFARPREDISLYPLNNNGKYAS